MLCAYFHLKIGVSFMLFTFLLASPETKAQLKDTVDLLEINVITTRIHTSNVGKKTHPIDSTTLELFRNQTLADVLSFNTPVFIKNYGPGALSTSSFRGGNAAQTAILWNGLNIQNNMLGQVDLSSISSNLFNQVDIEYGGSSAIWGSGAMGGAIHLNNTHKFNRGLYTKLNYQIGDIGSKALSTDIGFSNNRFSFKLKAFGTINKNTFDYFNKDSNKVVKQDHANYEQYSAMPELKFKINTYQNITAAAWLSKGERNFPNRFSSFSNKTIQSDASERMSLNWNYLRNKFSSNIKTAYFKEKLDYTDSLAKINSKSKMRTVIVENDNYYEWRNGQTLNLGANYTLNGAETNNYKGIKQLQRIAFIAGNRGYYLKHKLVINTSFRIEQSSTKLTPFTYQLGIDYLLTPSTSLKASAGKVYRMPTLNDMYWNPGGNMDLKPEEGYTMDGTLEYKTNISRINFLMSASIFNKTISNWILWLPSNGGYSSPMNIQAVWSRGTETNWQITYSRNKFKAQVKLISGYVLSTVKKSALENDNTLDRQLIYTPRYNFNSIITLSYNKLLVSYLHNYVGYRFTSSDNSTWLDPYHYSTIRLMYSYNFQKIHLGVFSNLNNVLNTKFEIISNRPMPLRNMEIGLTLNFNQKTT